MLYYLVCFRLFDSYWTFYLDSWFVTIIDPKEVMLQHFMAHLGITDRDKAQIIFDVISNNLKDNV